MPSPFPGMNPYLEQASVWHSFHEQFPAYCQEVLTPQVRPKYFIKLDVNIYIHELPENQRYLAGRPDLTIGHGKTAAPVAGVKNAALTAPVIGRLGPAVDIVNEAFIEIYERESRRVVTVIELLSPTNKSPGVDRDTYLAKRHRYAHSKINLIEIDLLRGGPRMPVEGLPPCDYCIMVSPAEERPQVGLWPIMIRQPLPTIPVPLLESDPPASLNLQELLHRLYDAGGYEDYIYSGAPEPPLSEIDSEWARGIISRAAPA
jgi:hypothetical protein